MIQITGGSVRHPSRFTDEVLGIIDELLGDAQTVLDPFAGTGRIHELQPKRVTTGIEIEPEWARMSPWTQVGDATDLPFGAHVFDAVATSPTFGNRMADHHEARDDSKRNTYRHTLGRELSPNNSGAMQWGMAYRALHLQAWTECLRVLKPRGRFILHMKDHIRRGERMRVTDWHVECLRGLGFREGIRITVPTPGLGFGENYDIRVGYEEVILLWTPPLSPSPP